MTKLSEADMGMIKKGMALRVKYRKVFKERGEEKKTLELPPLQLVVAHGNRGGVYPNENAVRDLGVFLLKEGFDVVHQDVFPLSRVQQDLR